MVALETAVVPLPDARITAPALRRALIAGIRRVVSQRETLNRINVFPVPDGDTGSNLAFTLGTVLSGALSRRPDGRRVAAPGRRRTPSTARAATPARSWRSSCSGAAEGRGRCAACSRRRCWRARRRPARAGARRAGAAARRHHPERDPRLRRRARRRSRGAATARGGFAQAAAARARALADTPKQLPVLRQAGVVDAGAQGFVDLLEGIETYIAPAAGRTRRSVDDEGPNSPAGARATTTSIRRSAGAANAWSWARASIAPRCATRWPPRRWQPGDRRQRCARARACARRRPLRAVRAAGAFGRVGAPRPRTCSRSTARAARQRRGDRHRQLAPTCPEGVAERARHPRGAGAREFRRAGLPRQGRRYRRTSSTRSCATKR